MKKRSRYSYLLLIGLMAVGGGAGAQGVFSWRAGVDTIRKDGFYQILLTPGILAKCGRADLADLRILGQDKRFVSYVLKDPRGRSADEIDWLPVPNGAMVQGDSSNKHSYIEVHWPEAYEIDRLGFTIRDPVFYKREAEVFAAGARTGEWTFISSYSLAPGSTYLSIPAVKTSRLRVDITNADNAPLVVRGVSAFQAPRFLLSYLRAGGRYELLAGNALAAAPEYDLKYFTDSLTTMPPTLVPGPVQHAAVANDVVPSMAAKPVTGERSGGMLLWGILLALLIFLTYFSVKMVRSITQKETNDRI